MNMKKGTRVNLKVENLLDEPTMLHWHGLVVPFSQDGVPGLTGQALKKGGGVGIYDFDIDFYTFLCYLFNAWNLEN